MRARIEEFLDNRWLLFISRLLLGGIFLVAGIPKLQNPDVFINTVESYGMLPSGLAQFYGLVVPWVELFIGFCLIFAVVTRFVAFLSILLIASFMMASVYALFNPNLVVCGCFGEIIQLSHPASLSLDFIMLAMALLVLSSRMGEEFLSIGHLLSGYLSRYYPGSGRKGRLVYDIASKLAIVALAMAVVAVIVFIGGGARDSFKVQIDTALEQNKPVFAYFYSEECSACEEVEPMIDEMEQEYGDRIAFIHFDYWQASQLVKDFGVDVTPTMLLITDRSDDGQYTVHQRFDKTMDEETARDSLEQVLNPTE